MVSLYKAGNANYNVNYSAGAALYREIEQAGGTFVFRPVDFDVAPTPAPVPGGGLLSFVVLGLAALAYRSLPRLAAQSALAKR